jgi:hypothetical protein
LHRQQGSQRARPRRVLLAERRFGDERRIHENMANEMAPLSH